MVKIATYTVRDGSVTVRKRSTTTPYTCVAVGSSIAGGSKTQSLPESIARSYTKGDHVHAYPFNGVYISCSPMAGRVSTFLRAQPLSGGNFKYCGENAGSFVYQDADTGYFFPAKIATVPVAPAGLIDQLTALAETKALADLRRSYYNLGIILAERKKSVSYVTDKAAKLMRLAKAKQEGSLKRYFAALPRDRRRIAKEISSEHLAFIFGLLPLVSEIEGICKLLAAEDTLVITGRGRQALDSMTGAYQSLLQTDFSDVYKPVCLGCTDETNIRFSVRTSVSVRVTSAASQQLRDHGVNFLATFYDIIPLSFLCDFVSNTGTFIRSLDPLLGVEFLTGNTTAYSKMQCIRRVAGKSHVSGDTQNKRIVTTTGEGYSVSEAVDVRRRVLTTYPESQFVFQNNLSVGKAFTLAALAIQRYVKPVRSLIKIRTFRYRGPRPKYLKPISYK